MKHEISKMKVLDLQELAEVEGGKSGAPEGASPQAWSTMSRNCTQVEQNEWSTMSDGCGGGGR